MSRRWFLILPLIVVCLLLIQNWAVFKAVEWSVKAAMEKSFQGQLEVDVIDHKGSTVSFKGLRVKRGAEVPFVADSVVIHWDLQFFKRTLFFEVEVMRPESKLTREQIDLVASSENTFLKFLKLQGSVKIQEGKVDLPGGPAELELFVSFFEDKQWNLALKQGPASFSLLGNEEKGTYHGVVEAQKFPLAILSDFVDTLAPSLIEARILTGTLNGEFAFHYAPDFRPRFDGHFSLYDFVMHGLKNGYNLDLKLLTADFKPLEPQKAYHSFLPHLEGQIILARGSKIEWGKFGKRPLIASDLDGYMRFHRTDSVEIGLNGIEEYDGEEGSLKAYGNVNFASEEAFEVIFNYLALPEKPRPTLLELKGSFKELNLHIQNFGIQQFSLLEALLHKWAPGLNPIDFKEGRVDAKVKATLQDKRWSTIAVEKLEFRNLACFAPEWECRFGAQSLRGSFHMDLDHPNPLETLDADLWVVHGKLHLMTPPVDLWKFTDIQTQLRIHSGVIQKSSASMKLAGLKGAAEIDGGAENLLILHLEGKGNELLPFMPERVRSGIERHSFHDQIFVDLTMQKRQEFLLFNGGASVHEPSRGQLHQFAFGFELEPPDRGFELSGDEFAFWFEEAPKWLPELYGPYGVGIAQALLFKMQSEVGLFGFKFAEGWIESKEVPLEKFVSPYIFANDDMRLSGQAKFKGQFDLKGIALTYTATNVMLDTDKVQMTMKEVPGAARDELLGEQYVDFATGHFRGKVPLEKATYFDKTKSLLFTDISSVAFFDGRKVFLPQIRGSCNALDVYGDIVIDNTDERVGYFDVVLDIKEAEGTVESALSLLEKIDPAFEFKWPVEGYVHLRETAHFQFYVQKEHFVWTGNLNGRVDEGYLHSSLCAKEIEFDFDFDKEKDSLLFSNVSTTFFWDEKDEFIVEIDRIGFDRLETKEGTFKIQVFSPQGELLHLQGHTLKEGDHLNFAFDPEVTHFFKRKPEILALQMSEEGQIQKFQFDGTLDLHYLPGFEGQLQSHISYFDEHGKWLFNLRGHQIQSPYRLFNEVFVSGDYGDGTYRVLDAKADDLTFTLNALKQRGKWILEHLGLTWGDAVLLGLEGEWEEEDFSTFQGRVNLLEVDLERVGQFDELKPFYEAFYPKGTLKGSGKLTCKGGEIEAAFTTRFKNLELKGLLFQDLDSSSLNFTLGKGIQFSHLKTALLYPETHAPLVDLYIEKILVDFESDITDIENLRFAAPSVNLPWLAAILEKNFPISPSIKQNLSQLKKGGIASGILNLHAKSGEYYYKATLDDGLWHIFGHDRELKNFTLEVNPEEIKVASQYLAENHWLWLIARINQEEAPQGVMVISDGISEEEPIHIRWEHTSKGLVIHQMKGHALGLFLDLTEDHSTPDWLRLTGRVGLNFSKAASLFPLEIREKLRSSKLGAGFSLNGTFQIGKNEEHPYYFTGALAGHLCEIKGFCFDELYAHLEASHEAFHLSQIYLKDPALFFKADFAHFDKTPYGNWTATIPLIQAHDIRPSLLREVGDVRSTEVKPLIIQELLIQDISGPLSNLRGSGYLHFSNPPKKNLHNTIFALPAEIISRIGVDLVALTPVTGTLSFQIKDDIILLTKMKDVYSDGKLSKFYLASSPSYMTLDGDLHLQIKMKQYTLLFKLAELFTFNIEGPLSKPTYSIKKGGGG